MFSLHPPENIGKPLVTPDIFIYKNLVLKYTFLNLNIVPLHVCKVSKS